MKRLLVLLLALAMLMPLLVACNNEDPEVTGSRIPSTESDWFHNLDFGGKTIITRYNDSGVEIYMKGPDQKGSDTVLDRCYDRNLSVKATLNLKVEQRVGHNNVEYMNEIALMPTGAPDFITTSYLPTVSMSLQGFIRDVKHAPEGETSYYDFKASCWMEDFMQSFALDDTRYFALAGDFFIDILRDSECLYLNTNYYEEKMTDTLEDFYTRVERGGFDADYMQYMLELAYEDTVNQGYVDEGDRLGMIWRFGHSFYPWIFGTDTSVLSQSGTGEWIILDNPVAFNEMVEEVMKVLTVDGSCVMSYKEGGTEEAENFIMDKFREGRLLFATLMRIGDLEHSKMLEMQNKLAIPYPITDPSQSDYKTFVNFEAEVGMIPVQAKQNFTEVSAYLQLLNEQSSDIVTQYFEESLKFKYSTEAVGAGRMLDVIYDSIGATRNFNILYQARDESGYSHNDLPRLELIVSGSIGKGQNNFTAQWASYREAYRAGLEEYKRKYAELK